jgi:hypothetical protein
MMRFAKALYLKRVPRVRIPASPLYLSACALPDLFDGCGSDLGLTRNVAYVHAPFCTKLGKFCTSEFMANSNGQNWKRAFARIKQRELRVAEREKRVAECERAVKFYWVPPSMAAKIAHDIAEKLFPSRGRDPVR